MLLSLDTTICTKSVDVLAREKNQGGVGERTKLKAKNNSPIPPHLICTCPQLSALSGAPNDNFLKNICSEDDFRPRIFGTFVVKFLACMPLLGFSNI